MPAMLGSTAMPAVNAARSWTRQGNGL